MSTQRYSVTPQPIDTVLAWVKSGEIADRDAFLRERRALMSKKIQTWFDLL